MASRNSLQARDALGDGRFTPGQGRGLLGSEDAADVFRVGIRRSGGQRGASWVGSWLSPSGWRGSGSAGRFLDCLGGGLLGSSLLGGGPSSRSAWLPCQRPFQRPSRQALSPRAWPLLSWPGPSARQVPSRRRGLLAAFFATGVTAAATGCCARPARSTCSTSALSDTCCVAGLFGEAGHQVLVQLDGKRHQAGRPGPACAAPGDRGAAAVCAKRPGMAALLHLALDLAIQALGEVGSFLAHSEAGGLKGPQR